MKKVLLLLCDGTEILEAAAFFDVFGWTGTENTEQVKVITAGLRTPVKCAFGLTLIPDICLPEPIAEEFNALAIPGGLRRFGYYADAYSESALELIKKFGELNKPIASICVGALPVAKAGLLTNRRGTTYHLMNGSFRKQLAEFGVRVIDEPLVRDGNIITSTSPGTAVEVALTLLAEMTGIENADHIRRIMGFDKNFLLTGGI
jgi:protein deglycase